MPGEIDADDMCVICLEALVDPIIVTPCGHTDHAPCLIAWLSIRPLCPVCKQGVEPVHVEEGVSQSCCGSLGSAVPAWRWMCDYQRCTFVLCKLIMVTLMFYVVVYAGKVFMWCVLQDDPRDEMRSNLTQRDLQFEHWSPSHVSFGDVFSGMIAILMTMVVLICCSRVCGCRT